jgi:putative Holliday junction resolvase
MRILGIDYGDKKVGFSLSDLLKITAQPLESFRYNSRRELFSKIIEIVNNYNVSIIVVGFPKNMNGTVGVRGEKTLEFVEDLKNKIENTEITTWDERLSTVSAKRVMIETGVKRKNKEKMEDKIAAVFILQSYLDSKKT